MNDWKSVQHSRITQTAGRKSRRPERGAAMVEMAVVMPLLFSLLLGIMEFAWIGYHKLTLANATRAAVRSAALRSETGHIAKVLIDSAPGLKVDTAPAKIEVTYCLPASNLCGDLTRVNDTTVWQTVSNSNGQNNAPMGSLVRVRVLDWPHEMITGSFFDSLLGVTDGKKPLSAAMTMRRE